MITAQGAFRVLDQASDPMKKITAGAKAVDTAVGGASKALKDMDSPQVRTSINNTQRGMDSLTRSSTEMSTSVQRNTKAIGSEFEKTGLKVSSAIDNMERKLKVLSAMKSTPSVDLDISKAEAKLRLLREQLRNISTAEARKELNSMGLVVDRVAKSVGGGGLGGGGGSGGVANAAGGAGRGGLVGGFMAAAGAVSFMAVAITAALPAIVALTGAIAALIGSFGAAVVGAGVLGVGAFASLIVGIGAIMAVAKPAVKSIQEVHKAQLKYNTAVQEYGNKSAQAIKAHRALLAEYKKNPGTGTLLNNWSVFRNDFKAQTTGARQDFIGILNDGLKTAKALLPTLTPLVNGVMRAARMGANNIFAVLRSPEFRMILDHMGRTFQQMVGPASQAIGNLIMLFGRIADAASPYVIAMFQHFERWTGNLANQAANTGKLSHGIGNVISQLHSWVGLIQSLGKLMLAFFGSGAGQGQGIVQSMTGALDKWAQWIQDNPAKMQDFFSRTIDGAGKLVHALGTIGTALAHIADSLLPVLNMVSQLINTIGAANLAPLAVFASVGLGAAKLGKITKAGGGIFTGVATGATRLWTGGSRAAAADVGATTVMGTGARSGVTALEQTPMIVGPLTAEQSGYYKGARGFGRQVMEAEGAGRKLGVVAGRASGALGSLAMGVGRFLAPVSVLSGLLGAMTAPGGSGNRLMGFASGATFGLIPAPYNPAPGEIGNNAQGAVARSAAGMGPQSFKLPGYGSETLNLRAPYMPEYRDGRTILDRFNPLGGAGALPGFDPATGNFNQHMSRRAATQTLSNVNQAISIQRGNLKAPGLSASTQESIRGQITALNALRDAYKGVVQSADQLSRIHGSKAFDDLTKAFGIRSKHEGIGAAAHAFGENLHEEWSQLKPAGQKELLDATAAWTTTLEHGGKKQKAAAAAIKDDIVAQYKEMKQAVAVVNGNIIDITTPTWAKVHDIIGSQTEKALEEATNNFTKLQQVAVQALIRMGFSPGDASSLVQNLETGGQTGKNARTSIQAVQMGASSNAATHPVGDGWGMMSRAIGDGPGGDRISDPTAFNNASGHMTNIALMGASTDLEPYAQDAAKFGLSVSSGLRPGAITTSGNVSYHSSGRAIDLAAPMTGSGKAAMLSFAKHAASTYGGQLEELIHTPLGYSIKNGRKVPPYAQAEHYNHVHVADVQNPASEPWHGPGSGRVFRSGTGVGGNVSKRIGALRVPGSALGGVPGALSNRATSAYGNALRMAINQALGAAGGVGGSSYGGPLNRDFPMHLTGTAGATLSPRQVAMIANSVGLPGTTFAQIAHGESGYMPGIQQKDPGDGMVGYGLFQITPNAWGKNSAAYKYMQSLGGISEMFNPIKNAEMAKFLYDSAGHSIAPWYGTKYVTGAHGDGWGNAPTNITVHQVTGPHVSSGGGGTPSVHVSIGHIVNNEPGDIRSILERELDGYARSLMVSVDSDYNEMD